jgi:hypothetical protein
VNASYAAPGTGSVTANRQAEKFRAAFNDLDQIRSLMIEVGPEGDCSTPRKGGPAGLPRVRLILF